MVCDNMARWVMRSNRVLTRFWPTLCTMQWEALFLLVAGITVNQLAGKSCSTIAGAATPGEAAPFPMVSDVLGSLPRAKKPLYLAPPCVSLWFPCGSMWHTPL